MNSLCIWICYTSENYIDDDINDRTNKRKLNGYMREILQFDRTRIFIMHFDLQQRD
jgi:hypothetical protein